MTLWQLQQKCMELVHGPDAPADKPIKAILVHGTKPAKELDLIEIKQNNEGTFIHLKEKE